MHTVAVVLVALVALLHCYFLALEMFLWTAPIGRRTFGTTREFAQESKVLAANQGLYNGFLVAGLVWGLFYDDNVVLFFLACVVAAGLYGGATVSSRILVVQALPAVVAGGALLLA